MYSTTDLDPNPGLGELGAPVLLDVSAAAVEVHGLAVYVQCSAGNGVEVDHPVAALHHGDPGEPAHDVGQQQRRRPRHCFLKHNSSRYTLCVFVDGERQSVCGELVGPYPEHPAAPAALRSRLSLKLGDRVLVEGDAPVRVLARGSRFTKGLFLET